jgi:hypothetical protein
MRKDPKTQCSDARDGGLVPKKFRGSYASWSREAVSAPVSRPIQTDARD